MLLIHCPYCEQELPEPNSPIPAGAHRPARRSVQADGRGMARLPLHPLEPKGVHFERWRHINGCARFFNAARETVGDKFLSTYKAGEPRPDITSLTGDAK